MLFIEIGLIGTGIAAALLWPMSQALANLLDMDRGRRLGFVARLHSAHKGALAVMAARGAACASIFGIAGAKALDISPLLGALMGVASVLALTGEAAIHDEAVPTSGSDGDGR